MSHTINCSHVSSGKVVVVGGVVTVVVVVDGVDVVSRTKNKQSTVGQFQAATQAQVAHQLLDQQKKVTYI